MLRWGSLAATDTEFACFRQGPVAFGQGQLVAFMCTPVSDRRQVNNSFHFGMYDMETNPNNEKPVLDVPTNQAWRAHDTTGLWPKPCLGGTSGDTGIIAALSTWTTVPLAWSARMGPAHLIPRATVLG